MRHLFFILGAASLLSGCVVEDRRYPHRHIYHEHVVEVEPVIEERVEVHPHAELEVREHIR